MLVELTNLRITYREDSDDLYFVLSLTIIFAIFGRKFGNETFRTLLSASVSVDETSNDRTR